MYKLLVVDDENIIADGIANTVSWDSIGVEVTGCAANGLDALEKVRITQPDIIITDIKMDNMDGLTMVNEVGALYPFIKFIVLTGYDDPGFIRKSLDLRVFSYLLKPAGEEQLLTVVKQQIAEIEKERAIRKKIEMIDYELERNQDFFVERLLEDLLSGGVENRDTLESRAAFLGVSFKRQSYSCVLFSILDARNAAGGGGFHKLHNQFLAVEEIIKSFWKGEFWPVHIEQDKLVIILGGENIRQGIEWILENIDRFLDVSVTAAIGESCENILDIWKSYRQALLAYEGDSTPELPGIISLDEMPEAPGLRFIYPAEKENGTLESFIRNGSRQDTDKSVRELFDSMEQQGFQSSHIGMKIAMANRYMIDNFSNCDLSLDVISRYLQINPSYFSRIYKKETGQNFVEALTAIRLDRARTLLSATTMKINDIALTVGYQNSRYFWNIFRKNSGCSPSEYRETHFQSSKLQ